MVRWVDTLLESPLDYVLGGLQNRLGCFQSFGGIHTALLYETPQVTRIRDGKLGALYYFSMALVFYYIIWQLFVENVYLASEKPQTWAQVSVSVPFNAETCNLLKDADGFAENYRCKRSIRKLDEMDYCCSEKCEGFGQIKDHKGVHKPDACVCPSMAQEETSG